MPPGSAELHNIAPIRQPTMPKANSRRLDKTEKNVLVHLLQAPKLTNGDIAKIIDVDERTISRRRKQLRTLGHLSPERNVKGAEKLRPWHLEVCRPLAPGLHASSRWDTLGGGRADQKLSSQRVIARLEENNDLQLKDIQEYLKKEFDLHVTVSTISRQLSRANHARARRPGYKTTRPDLQPQTQDQDPQPQVQEQQQAHEEQQQPLPQPSAQEQDVPIVRPVPQPISPPAPEGQGVEALQQPAVESPARATLQQGQIPHVKLACPFFRHEPERFINGPFCQSSWHSVRDVKYVGSNLTVMRCASIIRPWADRRSENTSFDSTCSPSSGATAAWGLSRITRTSSSTIDHLSPVLCASGWSRRAVARSKRRRSERETRCVPLLLAIEPLTCRNADQAMRMKGDENGKWKRMFRILFPDVEQDAVPDGLIYEDVAYFTAQIDPNLEGWQGAAPQVQQADQDEV